MYGECEGSQDKNIVMVSIRKGPQERRCGTKRRDEKKSATQEENSNSARCIEKMLLCEPETGKSMLCQACKTAKVQCERPREESQSQR